MNSKHNNKDQNEKKQHSILEKDEVEEECFVCMEKFNKKTRKKVVCPNYIEQKNKKNEVISRKPCEYTCCSSCLRRYIEQSGSTAKCMNCKNHLPREFLIQNLTKKWIEGKYKDHHSHLLYETEKAKCPEIMSFVEDYNNLDKLKEIQNDIKNTIRDLKTQLINNENKIKKLTFFDFTRRQT